MKIGFLLNITLLLCFACSYLLIMLIDGSLVRNVMSVLDGNAGLIESNRFGDNLTHKRKSNERQQENSNPPPFKLVETKHGAGNQKTTHQHRFQNQKQSAKSITLLQGEPYQAQKLIFAYTSE